MKFTDDMRMVAYEYQYTTHDGRLLTTLVNYGYEREGRTAEELLADAIAEHGPGNPRIMTFAEFDELDREMTLALGVHEVDEETFDEMLNVLPPLKWGDRFCERLGRKVNEFCMSEFDHSVFTQQYARVSVDGKMRYYSATVDYFDESTWIHNRL